MDTLDLQVAEGLPIAARADELVAALRAHQVVVVAGETGSGKSTQLPKLCLAAGRGTSGMIGHTQPRRVAARTVAERVGAELKAPERVAWSVRFDDRVSDQTLVRVMTDGILLNEIQRDRELRRYDTIIVDEAHERSLNIDFILGYLKQLLPRRPDLHVVVTSATIDTERFAAHFADSAGAPAPVFVVEGRTYPVEVRYRPYSGETADAAEHGDQVRAVIEAVDELHAAAPGDVLVFLSGEREIHDAADALREHDQRIEVLPLYARLSAAEQHRIFTPSNGRRVVLSTNVAETSLTVPGVRYVVDAGTARISRYSRRLKVQRLPIEPVSQASANQRAGRCGRVAPGICIRLYSADDFAARDEFTEPEVLRTNLASVILQMTAIGLGDVARFPFVEAPDSSQIRDGYLLLEELGALRDGTVGQPRKLTDIGRQLARLPIDPRLGRMVVEAERRNCVREVLVIASALSIQDVRERPSGDSDQAAVAVGLHRRFAVEGSDLLSVVALWDYLAERQAELSGNRFRRMCRDEHLNYLRVREWRDLYSQLRRVAGSLGIRPEQHSRGDGVTAHPDHVHKALLAGLLSHLGEYDPELREFRGARDSRFSIARDSVLAKRPPRWVMAAELVETNRLWARRVAAIQPEWAEQVGAHLVKRSYSEAWWDTDSGRALTAETVMLYGRPIVANRTIGVDRVDPRLAREMFIRHALLDQDVEERWAKRHEFLARNARFLDRVALLEARVRRGDLVDPERLYEFYDGRLGADVTSTRHFDTWWKAAGREQPELLDFTRDVLASRAGIRLADYPDEWVVGTAGEAATYRLVYRFDPGTPLDGATLTIPLTGLQQALDSGLPGRDWLVPGYRADLVDLLVRSLPKDLRRTLIPLTDTATAAAARLAEQVPGLPDPGTPPLLDALAAVLRELSGQDVRPRDFDTSRLPEYLHVHLVVTDAAGNVVDAGDDLAAIAARQSGSARAAVAATVTSGADGFAERHDIVRWDDVGTLDQVIEQRAPGGHVVRAYPTLLDRGDRVALRVVDNPGLQERAMRGGVRRLLLMAAAPTPAKVAKTLDGQGQLAVAAAGFEVGALVAECIEAAVDAILARSALPWDAPAFGRIERSVTSEAAQLAADALAEAADVLAAAGRVHRRLLALTADAGRPTSADAAAHLERLIAPGFVRRAGTDRLPDVHRYVRGIEHRLDHLAGDIARDQRRMAEVRPLERAYAEAVAGLDRVTEAVRDVAWLLEEFRVATFAPAIGVHGQVSPKRIRDAYQSATGTPLPT
ncbi:MAG TPA: ATP-dependent RNA helicase HrpA [Ilumatobacter sp.]|nr:ATP-dependent RNA helicase HrpA [Ilumatobacter sp.]